MTDERDRISPSAEHGTDYSRSVWDFMADMLQNDPMSAVKAVLTFPGRGLSDEIRREMRSRQLTQAALAEKMGRSTPSVSRFLRGLDEGRINIMDLARLSIVFGLHLNVSLTLPVGEHRIEYEHLRADNAALRKEAP